MKIGTNLLHCTIASTTLLSAERLYAAIQTPTLPGNTQFDAWPAGSLNRNQYANNGVYPSFSSSRNAWPATIDSRGAGSGDGVIRKVANGTGGGPTLLSESMYFAGFDSMPNTEGGTVAIDDPTPVAAIRTVLMQIDLGQSFEARDFFNGAFPVLNFNGGAQAVASGRSGIFDRVDTGGTFPVPGGGNETIFRATYFFEWDLASVPGPITSFSLQFTGVQHLQVYGLRVDQSDQFSAFVVPEPAALSLLTLPALALVRRKR